MALATDCNRDFPLLRETLRRVDQAHRASPRTRRPCGQRARHLDSLPHRQGQYQRALAEVDKASIQTPGSDSFRAQALALSGRRDEALAELDRVLELSTKRYVSAYDIALIHAALLDTESTFLWLERAVQDRSTLINFLAQDPMFDTLHWDPRFASLVRAHWNLSSGIAGKCAVYPVNAVRHIPAGIVATDS